MNSANTCKILHSAMWVQWCYQSSGVEFSMVTGSWRSSFWACWCSLSKNVLALLVKYMFWSSICSKYKCTRTHAHTHAHTVQQWEINVMLFFLSHHLQRDFLVLHTCLGLVKFQHSDAFLLFIPYLWSHRAFCCSPYWPDTWPKRSISGWYSKGLAWR